MNIGDIDDADTVSGSVMLVKSTRCHRWDVMKSTR
jgi:hypothetical protein